jgi:hypothetical protein
LRRRRRKLADRAAPAASDVQDHEAGFDRDADSPQSVSPLWRLFIEGSSRRPSTPWGRRHCRM